MPIRAVHQFHPACAEGDGITSGLLLTQKLLRRLGYESEIFCEMIPPEFASRVRHLSTREDSADDVLLFHHSLGYRHIEWLERVSGLKVLVYHNITPDFLLPEGELRALSRLGRDQLQTLRPLFAASVGDSEENAAELRGLGYRDVRVLPLLVDFERTATIQPTRAVVESLRDSVNVLFVGRVADNKRQLDIVDCFNLYHRHFEPRARLQLVGGCTSGGYRAHLRRKLEELELEEVVSLTGKVSDQELAAYFEVADVYLSLSEHEGFGMPLIEAMLHGVPVIAHASASIPWTVGPGGLLLQTRDPEFVASTLDQVVSNAALRRAMRRGARRSLGRFAPPVLQHGLSQLLQSLGGPERPFELGSNQPGTWRVDDADLATALTALGLTASSELIGEDVTLRSRDPQHTEGMRGLVRVFFWQGEEQAAGFPPRQANSFNQRLDLVTTRSLAGRNVLMDAGVKVPIAVVGGGDASLTSIAQRTRAAVDALASLPQFSPQLKLGWLTPWRPDNAVAEYAKVLLEQLPTERGPILADRTQSADSDPERVVRCWSAEDLGEAFEQSAARGLDALVIQYDARLVTPGGLAALLARLRDQGITAYCICHSTAELTDADGPALGIATRLFVRSEQDLEWLRRLGLGGHASLLLDGEAMGPRLRNVIESCEVNRRFERLLPEAR